MIMSEHIDSLILEEEFQMIPNMADSGIRIQLTTVFGKCEHYLMKDKVKFKSFVLANYFRTVDK